MPGIMLVGRKATCSVSAKKLARPTNFTASSQTVDAKANTGFQEDGGQPEQPHGRWDICGSCPQNRVSQAWGSPQVTVPLRPSRSKIAFSTSFAPSRSAGPTRGHSDERSISRETLPRSRSPAIHPATHPAAKPAREFQVRIAVLPFSAMTPMLLMPGRLPGRPIGSRKTTQPPRHSVPTSAVSWVIFSALVGTEWNVTSNRTGE